MKRSELSKDYLLFHIDDGGNRMLSKYPGVSIACQLNKNDLYLYGEMEGDMILFLERIPFSGRFYPKNFKSAGFAGGKVSLCSQVEGKATVICNIFAWASETMKFEKEESYDLSKIQTDRANNLLSSGKTTEAMATFDSVMYASVYYDSVEVGIHLLTSAYKESEALATRRKFKEGAGLIERVLKFKGLGFIESAKSSTELETKFGKALHGMTYENLGNIIASYCKYYVDARLYDNAITIANRYKRLFPKNTDLLLYLGDAWYAKKDKAKASEAYQLYTDKMKEKKKEKDIPSYVPPRITN